MERKQRLKTIIARYKYYDYVRIQTKDTGTYLEMLAKYQGKYEFWCGDIPPEKDDSGGYSGYRLDGSPFQIQQWGKHKAWIDPRFKVRGKPVILVWKAK